MIEEALGPRPSDPAKAALWNEGVELIYAYRQRNGVLRAERSHPLGARPKDAVRQAERRDLERRLARIQGALGREPIRAPERTPTIGL